MRPHGCLHARGYSRSPKNFHDTAPRVPEVIAWGQVFVAAQDAPGPGGGGAGGSGVAVAVATGCQPFSTGG